jgi:hypothetical protein
MLKTKENVLTLFSEQSSLPYKIALLCLKYSNVDTIVRTIQEENSEYDAIVRKVWPR